jgi:hypothetical protein
MTRAGDSGDHDHDLQAHPRARLRTVDARNPPRWGGFRLSLGPFCYWPGKSLAGGEVINSDPVTFAVARA